MAEQQAQACLVQPVDAQAAHGAYVGPHMHNSKQPEGSPDEQLAAGGQPNEGHADHHANQRDGRLLQAEASGRVW